MRIAVLTGLFACTLILSLGTVHTSALASDSAIQTEAKQENDENFPTVVALLSAETTKSVLKVLSSEEILAQLEQKAPEAPQEIKHVVTENETLTVIAKQYNIEWKRLFDKNTALENPDVLTVGLELVIPQADEVLTPRELPELAPQPVIVTPVAVTTVKKVAQTKAVTAQNTASRGSVAGNGYVAGYCTWYVKNRRPDLPNNLGNASSWVSRAAAQGIATGSTPRVGAVGQHGNHVVYVESVNDDGTVTISEMNHKGLYVQTTRTLSASYFSYIY